MAPDVDSGCSSGEAAPPPVHRKHSAADKIAVLPKELVETQSVSAVGEEYDISPTLVCAGRTSSSTVAAPFAEEESDAWRELERVDESQKA